MALVNQQTNSRQGNANYIFYKLAANQPSVFNDVATGTIAMPCQAGVPNCTKAVPTDQYGVLSGYTAGVGYDLATGLGSVNVATLVNKWNTVTFNASTTTLNNISPASFTHGQTATVTVTVTGSSGTPTGSIALEVGPNSNGQEIDTHVLTNGTATWTTAFLPGGSYSVKAHYAGDGNYGSSDSAPIPVTVSRENSSTGVQLITFNANGIENNNATAAVYGSPYILRVNVLNQAASLCATYPSPQSGCPSGVVTLTDAGSPLDLGTYTLNNLGYFEDQPIQLPGGSHSIVAQYAGDNSYAGSTSSADAITITRASTTISGPSIDSLAAVGYALLSSATVQARSSGLAPSGTVTFFANGAPVPGTVTYQSVSGSLNGNPYLQANFQSSASPFSKPGNYTISVNYSGDVNYGSSSASASTVAVQYPPPQVTLQSSANTVSAGTTVTLTALVMSSSPTVAPTGTITITSTFGQVPGTPVYSTIVDQIGNLDLQETLSYTASASDNFTAHYSGDSNYPGGSGSSAITVNGSDFNLAFPTTPLTVAKGLSGKVNLFVGMQLSSTIVTFTATPCAGLPAESTCSIFPTNVSSTGTVQLSVVTSSPHSSAQKRAANILHPNLWIIAFGVTFFGICLLGSPTRERRRGLATNLMLVGLMAFGLGCGGGNSNSGNGPTDPGTPSGTYTVTVTGTSGSLTHTATFQLIVQ
jgi:hypothetical protein